MIEFAFSCGFGKWEKFRAGYPQSCGKSVDTLEGFGAVFHSQKDSRFWLFGSYPGFPPYYGYSC